MVQGIFELFNLEGNKRDSTFELHKAFFNLAEYSDQEGLGMEKILSGLIRQVRLLGSFNTWWRVGTGFFFFQPGQTVDRFVDSELTTKLFPEEGEDFGSDLVSHGIYPMI